MFIRKAIIYLVIIIYGFQYSDTTIQPDASLDSCELITGECTDQPYNYTIISNSELDEENNFGTQKAADATIRSFEILMPCSNYLKLFLCATYKPSCYQEASMIIQPCRSMCEHVYSRCFPLMDKFKKKWNSELNCSRFLDDTSLRCMNDEGYKKDLSSTSIEYVKQIDLLLERVGLGSSITRNTEIEDLIDNKQRKNQIRTSTLNIFKKTTTRSVQKQPSKKIYNEKSSLSGEDYLLYSRYKCFDKEFEINMNKTVDKMCWLKCDADVLFDANEKQTGRALSLSLSVISLLCSLFTILSFMIKSKNNYVYPTCAFVFISISNAVYSLVNLTVIYLGKEMVVCQEMEVYNIDAARKSYSHVPIIKSHYVNLEKPFENGFCSISLLITYYFRLSSVTWWLIMCLSWFVLVQFQIKPEKLNKKANSYFHFIAWFFPAGQTLFILLFRNGDISELLSNCSIGNNNPDSLLKFIILPSFIYVFIGLLMILLGFRKILILKLIRGKKFDLYSNNNNTTTTTCNANSSAINYSKTREKVKTSSLNPINDFNSYLNENNLIHCGILATFSSFSVLILICCEVYEYFSMGAWRKLPNHIDLEYYDEMLSFSFENSDKPKLSIFILKILVTYLNGVIVFVLSVISNNLNTVNSCSREKEEENLDDINNDVVIRNTAVNIRNNTSVMFDKRLCGVGNYTPCELDGNNNNNIDHPSSFKHFHHANTAQQIDQSGKMNYKTVQCECRISTPIKTPNSLYVKPMDADSTDQPYANCLPTNDDMSLIESPQNGHHYCTPNMLHVSSTNIHPVQFARLQLNTNCSMHHAASMYSTAHLKNNDGTMSTFNPSNPSFSTLNSSPISKSRKFKPKN